MCSQSVCGRPPEGWDGFALKILCAVELQEILILEEWRVTLVGEKG
jgi:hypothetical protein